MPRRSELTRPAPSDAHRHAILSNIPDQAWLKDSECRYLAVNEAYRNACGLPERNILGRRPTDIWPIPIALQFLATDNQVLETGVQQRYEEKRPDRRGRTRSYETIKTPVRNSRGRIIGTAGISRDITHRKKLERDLRKSRTQLRELSNHLHSVREEERARMARELHDELGQNLTALRLGLDWAEAQLLPSQERLAEKLTSLRDLAAGTVASMARIATDLRPIILDDLGLSSAFEWLVEGVASQSGIEIELSNRLSRDPSSHEITIMLFRILQEALTNVVRHAGASRVNISLGQDERAILLTVSDNGHGFTPSAMGRSNPALGLLGMRERAAAVGGELTIESRIDQGTFIVLRVPWRPRRRIGAAS